MYLDDDYEILDKDNSDNNEEIFSEHKIFDNDLYMFRNDDEFGADLYKNGNWIYKRQWKWHIENSKDRITPFYKVMPEIFCRYNNSYNDKYDNILTKMNAPLKCMQIYLSDLIEIERMNNDELEKYIEEKKWLKLTNCEYDNLLNINLRYYDWINDDENSFEEGEINDRYEILEKEITNYLLQIKK